MILAGDVGGTKTNLALFRRDGPEIVEAGYSTYDSRAHASIGEILSKFLSGRGSVARVCIGVAGPVVSGKSRLTNLSWIVDVEEIRAACKVKDVYLVNDLQAMAFAVPFLPPGKFSVLQKGAEDPTGPVAVLAAGTGFGTCVLLRHAGRLLPLASEGGHADFAPKDDREVRLLHFLQEQFGRVSVERIVSGPGLSRVYSYLRDVEEVAEDPAVSARIAAAADAPREIVRAGLSGESKACGETIRFFCSLYGSAAGNAALQFMATGGIVLGGGVAPALLPVLSAGPFLEAFRAKGRFRDLLERVPVKVLLDESAPLVGAARFALSEGGGPFR